MSSRDLTPCVKRSRDRIMVKSPMVIITVNPPASQPMAETGCTHSTACTLENIAIVGAELGYKEEAISKYMCAGQVLGAVADVN